MKLIHGMLTLAIVILLSTVAFAADEPTQAQEMPPMGPPPEIQEQAFMIGTWTFDGEMRMAPDAEWEKYGGEVVFSYVAGGAAIQMEWTSAGMMGMTHHGLSITAYDREMKQWQETWVDNMGGRISMYTGNYVDGKRIMSGIDMMNGQEIWTRNTSYDITESSYKWIMENSMDGQNWFESMRGTYTKAK